MALALALAAGCGSPTAQPAPGSVLLDVRLDAGAQMPDEVRLSAYDDTGVLWQDARFPDSGALAPRSTTDLGTILLEPGATAGALRIDLRGLLRGVLVGEGTLTIPAASISGGTFTIALSASLPPDADGDGVPDPIDDCPSVPDPRQTGCPTDGGAGGTGGSNGSGGSPGSGGGTGGTGGSSGGSGGGAGGTGGGSGGTGGSAGTGGGAGTGGNTGTGGSAGTGGNAGAGGKPGTGGGGGTGGSAGAGGRAGTGGGAGAGGHAGAGGAGTGGSAGTTGNKGNGAGCGAPNECASGFCADGVCCNTACNASCQSCSTGKCNPVKNGEDVPECVAPMTCNGAGKCVAAAGSAGTGG